MTALSRVASLWGQLPKPTNGVRVQRDVPVPVDDGVDLLADVHEPVGAVNPPTLLVRSPYGRRGLVGLQYGTLYAERGYRVVLQSIRGGYGSGGVLDPMRQEAADGRATVEWLRRQAWFSGSFVALGPSYMGYAAWALADPPPSELAAVVAQIAPHSWRGVCYPGGALGLELAAGWARDISGAPLPDNPLTALVQAFRPHRDTTLRPALQHLPLSEAGRQAFGRDLPYFTEWLEHPPPADEYWSDRDASGALAAVDVPVLLIGGWQDLFLAQTLEQYAALSRREVPVSLTVGPWTHLGAAADAWAAMTRESLAFLAAVFDGRRGRYRSDPVRLYVTGLEQWRELPDWPPASDKQVWYLHQGDDLGPALPADSRPSRFRYDPTQPTPSVGGPTLWDDAGVRDNRGLESRDDVLTFTGTELDTDLQLAGPVSALVYLRSQRVSLDVFVRLCDVDQEGRSWNVTDGVRRVVSPTVGESDGLQCVEVELTATAHRFRAGHRLRLQVSGGAHPRIARNLGTTAALRYATEPVTADVDVFHDPAHPSQLTLPTVDPETFSLPMTVRDRVGDAAASRTAA